MYHWSLKVFITYQINYKFSFNLKIYASQCEASGSVAHFSALLNPTDAQKVSCLGLCGKLCLLWTGCSQSSVVSIYIVNEKKRWISIIVIEWKIWKL